MNYLFISLAVLLGLAAPALVIVYAVRRNGRRLKKALAVLAALAVEVGCVFVVYINIYYKADDAARKAIESAESVKVAETDSGYFFDGPGTRDAIVFYPGGKVECEAYAPLMSEIAGLGIDCYLLDMPFRLAIFNISAADKILSDESLGYRNIFLAGHSLGGVCAGLYAAKNADKVNGIIFLASYPTEKLPEALPCLSIYGSNDRVLNMKAYEASSENFPSGTKTCVIAGGNHAQFGSYGAQKGDGEPAVSPEQQWQQTAAEIAAFVTEAT